MYDIGLYGGKMENFKTAHVRFEDANIKFMENKISMLWTDTGCSTNCKKTSIVKLDDIEKIRYCVIKDNEYNFIQVKKKSDNEICSLDEAIKSETCFIVKENEEHAVNNMLEYIKKSYEGMDDSSKYEKIINLMQHYEKRLYKKTPNDYFYYGDKLEAKYKLIKKEFGSLVSLDEVMAVYGNSVAIDTVFTENGFYRKNDGFNASYFAYSEIHKLTIEKFMGRNVCVYLISNPNNRIILRDGIFGFVVEQWKDFLCDVMEICKKSRKNELVERIEFDADIADHNDSEASYVEEKIVPFENSIEQFPIGIGTVSVKKMEGGKYRIRIDHKSGRSYVFETTNNDIETMIARGAGRYNYKEFDNE